MANSFHKYAVEFPEGTEDYISEHEASIMMHWLMENCPSIYSTLKRGDFIENTTISGERCAGLYVVDMKDGAPVILNLDNEPDEYGTLPHSFADLPVGFHFNLVEDTQCASGWHNCLVPIDETILQEARLVRYNGEEMNASYYRDGYTLMWPSDATLYYGYAHIDDYALLEEERVLMKNPVFDE